MCSVVDCEWVHLMSHWLVWELSHPHLLDIYIYCATIAHTCAIFSSALLAVVTRLLLSKSQSIYLPVHVSDFGFVGIRGCSYIKAALPSTVFPEPTFFCRGFPVEFLTVRSCLKPFFLYFLSGFRFLWFVFNNMKRRRTFAFHNL